MLDRSKKSSSPKVGAERERYLKEEQERIGLLKEKLSGRKRNKTMPIPEKEVGPPHTVLIQQPTVLIPMMCGTVFSSAV